ncbi:MerR family transcriptional regulator [Conexibacter sp. W3-3-2]|uniref:MerR family transcriptional regulator n=1 Tax=Paraconexibacter algicola TaxID=2133960 RepID=A0A2T4UI83_9ACTN|nr:MULTISPECIES: MerR family transcriptional regulator [Solirubrobacterales]MTD45251.1 MerR family transcriptional regulator [Conexibacter sp. W3-3-2]PTL58951.1 MerR family transcriptional regulator [Paraconexibacter algicola]
MTDDDRRRTVSRSSVRVTVAEDRGVFMISVAAELAEMHPQTLRMYEARGLIEPQRSPKGTRLYSHADVERLRKIQHMTTEFGLNLAGVEKVMELEDTLERKQTQLEQARRKVDELEARAETLTKEIERLEAVREQVRADIVRYEQPGTDVVRAKDVAPRTTRIRIDRG